MLMATIAIAPTNAQLTAVEYGFPSIFQNAISTAFSRDIVSATNFENVNIDFGAAGLAGFGIGGFPSISQVSEQTYFEEHTDYLHTEETTAFNYPYVGVGGLSGLPLGLC
jgi:hypothetical protein